MRRHDQTVSRNIDKKMEYNDIEEYKKKKIDYGSRWLFEDLISTIHHTTLHHTVNRTLHTSFFSWSEHALPVAHHTAWLKNVLVRVIPSSWSSMSCASVLSVLWLCSSPCSFPCVSTTWTLRWTSSSMWSSSGPFPTSTPSTEESGLFGRKTTPHHTTHNTPPPHTHKHRYHTQHTEHTNEK